MILPPRPLALDPGFLRQARLRALGALAPAVAVIAVALLWQGRAGLELWRDQRAWDRGERVAVTYAHPEVRVIQGLARHVRISAGYVSADGTQRSVRDDYYTLFADAIGEDALSLREDEDGRVALSWSMRAAPWRWAWIGFFAAVFLSLGGAALFAAHNTLRHARTARAAARRGEEVSLPVIGLQTQQVHGEPAYVDVRYRAPPVLDDGPAAYRESARPPDGPVRTARFPIARGGPLLVDGGRAVLALRPSPRSDRVTVLASDFWPFALSEAERAAARAAIARREDQPPSPAAPASDEDASERVPPSGMSTQAPSSSKI